MTRFSLETLGEIVTRIETKIDKVNGSVASLGSRVELLEKKDIEHGARLTTVEQRQEEAKKAHSNFIWKILAPVGVTVIIAVGGILVRIAA